MDASGVAGSLISEWHGPQGSLFREALIVKEDLLFDFAVGPRTDGA